jgi:DNA-binding MarR family transcriptional regulator
MDDVDWSTVRVRELNQGHLTRKRRRSFLHIDDMEWLRRAYAATNSKARFAYALLLYRHCRLRSRGGKSPVVTSRALLDGFEISHDTASRTIRQLERAGLVEVEARPGSAYRVRILPTRKQTLR